MDWRDKWIHGCSLAQLTNLSNAAVVSKPRLQVSTLQDSDGTWNSDMIVQICGNEALPFILSIATPSVDDADELYWKLTGNGQYSSNSAYAFAFSNLWSSRATIKDRFRFSIQSKDFCKKELWSLPINNKWKIFLWKIFSNSLSCGEEALKRDLSWNFQCLTCNSDPPSTESLCHIFRDCPFAARIWFASPLGIRSCSGDTIPIQQWIINWPRFFKKNDNFASTISAFVSSLWHLWCLRNQIRFHDSPANLDGTLRLINTDAINNSWANTQLQGQSSSQSLVDPEECHGASTIINHYPYMLMGSKLCMSLSIRIKCDATWKSNYKATWGWYFQDHSGSIFHFDNSSFWAKSALQAEAMALKAAIMDATSQGFRHLDIASDCLNLSLGA
ncbi:uncharacterized protein LOC141608682 [Silene latifolia]|uniref:uncharacterized protein LOC141608682 n=1 Tax=Silene latifolia TaxID=37657 RepID=UPI003D77D58A